jgi:hypothetical protein
MENPNLAAIRVHDLANPELDDRQKAAIAHAASKTIDLGVGAVLDAASRDTGLVHFGEADFMERLAVQLQSVAEDTWMNDFGRMNVFNTKVQQASSRLRIVDALKRHPEITSIEIPRPIMIAGLPRSGTTHLLNMLAADARFRAMPYWESLQPVPDPGERVTHDENDPRYQRCARKYRATDAVLPLMKNMHDMNPDHIHEDVELLDIDFSSYSLEWMAHVPRWRDYYLAHDQTPHYAFLRKMLQLLSYYSGSGVGDESGGDLGAKHWVTKTPQHLEQLIPLHANFPDAIFLVTHRDPVEVLGSTATLVAYNSRLRNDEIHLEEIADYWIDRIERLLRACVRDTGRLPEDQTMDVLFPEFMADDLSMVQRVYELAGVPITRSARNALAAYLRANPRGKHGRLTYDIEADFGVRKEALHERFDFYYQRYPQLDPRRH